MAVSDKATRFEELQQEVEEIAEVLLCERPPGTTVSVVWGEALSLHRVSYETKVPGLEYRRRGG